MQTEIDNKQPKGDYVKTVNGNKPDASGNVVVDTGGNGSGETLELDTTLTQSGAAAEAKATGDKIKVMQDAIEAMGGTVRKYEPADGDTPLVFFTGVKPTTKDNVLAEMVYISNGTIINAYVKIKCQGSSSMQYDKKNFTVTLYQDEARTIPLYLEFKDWGIKINKFVLKADWIDASHSRNVCTARIWKDIVESRPDYDTLPVELKNAPGHGAIVGFPIAVYYNGNYEGLYNWNIGKDPWMWGMDEGNTNHAMLCAHVNNNGSGEATVCNFQGPLWSGVDGSGWDIEIGAQSTALKDSLNALISFVANSDEGTFVSGIEEYLDVQSAMDYYCLCYADCGLDGLGQNMTIGTYDGKKWYFGAYDLDCTWLLFWNGGKFVPADYRCPEDYQENANLLFDKFERFMTERLKTNYSRLRKGPLSEANIMRHFEHYIGAIGQERYADDLVAYPNIPQAATNNIRQIRTAVRDRLVYTDAEFESMVAPVPATGITLSESAITISGADNAVLVATVTPDDCTETVHWVSSDNAIATVVGGVVTARANGSCVITATVGSFSAACTVTVENVVAKYTIMRSLSGCTTNSDATTVPGGSTHTELISANDGYTLDGAAVSVTMAGVDITETAYAGGVVTIAEAAGDIVISVRAVVHLDDTGLVYSLPAATMFDGSTTIDTGYRLPENKSLTIMFEISDYTVAGSVFSANGNTQALATLDNSMLRMRMFAWTPDVPFNSDTVPMSSGGTRRCIAVYDSQTSEVSAKMSKDGVDVSNGSYGTKGVSYVAWKANLVLGMGYESNPNYIGTITDFRIYERALSEGEINAYLGI